jgi:hypothetical protein
VGFSSGSHAADALEKGHFRAKNEKYREKWYKTPRKLWKSGIFH